MIVQTYKPTGLYLCDCTNSVRTPADLIEDPRHGLDNVREHLAVLSGGPLEIVSSRADHLWGALCRA